MNIRRFKIISLALVCVLPLSVMAGPGVASATTPDTFYFSVPANTTFIFPNIRIDIPVGSYPVWKVSSGKLVSVGTVRLKVKRNDPISAVFVSGGVRYLHEEMDMSQTDPNDISPLRNYWIKEGSGVSLGRVVPTTSTPAASGKISSSSIPPVVRSVKVRSGLLRIAKFSSVTATAQRNIWWRTNALFNVDREIIVNGVRWGHLLSDEWVLGDWWIAYGDSVVPVGMAVASPVTTWKILVLVYSGTKLTYTDQNGQTAKMNTTIFTPDRDALVTAIKQLPDLARSFSGGAATVTVDVKYLTKNITRIAHDTSTTYNLTPGDVAADIDLYAPAGRYDTVAVIWTPFSYAVSYTGDLQSIPLSSAYYSNWVSTEANGATFISLATTPSVSQESGIHLAFYPLHEWLHGVIFWARTRGVSSTPNIDSPNDYGYTGAQSWLPSEMLFTSDVMTDSVVYNGRAYGLTIANWRSIGTPRTFATAR